MTQQQSRPPFFQLCCQEPFRIFFPLGALIGISGVSLWPLYFSGLHKFYPGIMHSRMMIEGFMTCFVIGFLGTAMPRLTDTPHFSRGELRSALALLIGAVGAHIAERYVIGDFIFLFLLLFFTARMSSRLSRSVDLPPPTFALVAFGILNAISGVVLLLIGGAGDGYPRCALLGMLLLYQGYLVNLVLGVGGFLLPRFLAPSANSEKTPATGEVSRDSRRRALLASGVAVALLASYFIEVLAEAPRIAGGIRFLAAAIFLFMEIPLRKSASSTTTITRSLRLALLSILLGLLFPILWPWQRVAGEHFIFIGGFTLITFTVATRVVFGHSGFGHRFAEPLPFLRAVVVLLLTAAALRVVGDFLPASRGPLLSAASHLWMLAAAIWSWRVLPKVRTVEQETSIPAQGASHICSLQLRSRL